MRLGRGAVQRAGPARKVSVEGGRVTGTLLLRELTVRAGDIGREQGGRKKKRVLGWFTVKSQSL